METTVDPKTATLDEVYYLDDATAIPLKVDSYRNQEALDKDRPFVTWVADKIEIVDGHAITPISSSTSYDKDGGVVVASRQKVDSIRFDAEMPISTFKPAIQPGVLIYNSLTKQSSHAPGAVSKDAMTPTVAVAPTAPPIYAEPPADYTGAWSVASILIGCALLAAAVAVWRGRMGERNYG